MFEDFFPRVARSEVARKVVPFCKSEAEELGTVQFSEVQMRLLVCLFI